MLRYHIIKTKIPVDKFCSNPLRIAKEWILSVFVLKVTFYQINITKKTHNVVNFFFKVTLRSCTHWVRLLNNCPIHTHKKLRLNVFFSSNICYYISDRLKHAKTIPCHINKVTTCVYVTPPPLRFIRKHHNYAN